MSSFSLAVVLQAKKWCIKECLWHYWLVNNSGPAVVLWAQKWCVNMNRFGLAVVLLAQKWCFFLNMSVNMSSFGLALVLWAQKWCVNMNSFGLTLVLWAQKWCVNMSLTNNNDHSSGAWGQIPSTGIYIRHPSSNHCHNWLRNKSRKTVSLKSLNSFSLVLK